MAGSEPLFTPERRSSVTSEERAAREDDALLGNQREPKPRVWKRPGFWRELGLFTWALLATAAVIVLAVVLQHSGHKGSPSHNGTAKKPKVTGKRNLIFMVSDGSKKDPLSRTYLQCNR
jgi:alkaline phosphatase